MKAGLTGILTAALVLQGVAAEKPVLKDQKEKVSYSIGMNLGNNLRNQSVDVDPEVLFKGIKDGIAGGEMLLTEAQAREVMMTFQQELRAKQEEKSKLAGEKNLKEGAAFLAENAKKPGVKTLPSGLQYKVLADGSGPIPKSNDTVTVHYRGTLLDGTEFDSSYKRGEPATFPVTGVIKGWTEALQLMKTGSKWQLFIPAALAYGERGGGRQIGPNAVLQFDVELIGIKPPPSETNQVVSGEIIKVPSAEELKKGAKIEVIKAPTNDAKPAPEAKPKKP
jgi:FKBP-type peptidyl-prolyl cis-trans isomerase FklB